MLRVMAFACQFTVAHTLGHNCSYPCVGGAGIRKRTGWWHRRPLAAISWNRGRQPKNSAKFRRAGNPQRGSGENGLRMK